jgi:hypothetical protein
MDEVQTPVILNGKEMARANKEHIYGIHISKMKLCLSILFIVIAVVKAFHITCLTFLSSN